MNLIVVVARDWAIGQGGELLFHIPKDMKHFKELTTGNAVIMGRKTLESFPGKRPLKNRTNIVITGNSSYEAPETILCSSPEEAVQESQKFKDKAAFVIGGEQIYRQLLPYCRKAYVTKVDAQVPADAFMVNLDEDPAWKLTKQSEVIEDSGWQYVFTEYTRING